MRRARRTIWLQLLMALLVFAGTSSEVLASLLCNTPSCPMEQASPVKEDRNCCPDSGNQKDGCCCEIESAPATTLKSSTIIIQLPADWIVPEAKPLVPAATLIDSDHRKITFTSDLSPPGPTFAPDLGRAPPTV